MDPAEIGLRLIGAFYVFAGVVATRAALASHVLDKALAGIGGNRLTRVEIAITTWHLVAASLVLASGLALMLLADLAAWLFVASAVGQAVYIYVVAPAWFDVADPPDPIGRQRTTNAFVIYSAVTALVLWAEWRGMLVPWQRIEWTWLAAAGAALCANMLYVLRIVAWPARSDNAIGGDASSFEDSGSRLASEARQVKVMAARECHPLWAMDEGLYGDFRPTDIGISQVLSGDIMAWSDAYTAMLVEAETAERELSQTQVETHQAEGRRLAERLARERPDLMVYVEDAEGGVVQVHAADRGT